MPYRLPKTERDKQKCEETKKKSNCWANYTVSRRNQE